MTKKDNSRPSYLQDTAASRGQSVSGGNRQQSGGGRGRGRGKGSSGSHSKSSGKKRQANTPGDESGHAGAYTPASGATRDDVPHSARLGSSSSDPLSNVSHGAQPASSSSDPLSDALYDQFRGSGLSSEEIRSRYDAPREYFGESPRPTNMDAGTSTLHVDTGFESTSAWRQPNSTASTQSNVVRPTELDFGGIDRGSVRSGWSSKRAMLNPEARTFTPNIDAAHDIPISGPAVDGRQCHRRRCAS